MHRNYFLVGSLLLTLLFLANLWLGSVRLSPNEVWQALLTTPADSTDLSLQAHRLIVVGSRLPAALTAVLTGAALGVCGLLLQSFFRNPLAGPSILGITSGANLAVAIILLCGISSTVGILSGALLGSFAIIFLLLLLGRFIRQVPTLLIVGILVSYLTNAVITLLNHRANADGIQSLMMWGMGSFSGVGLERLPLFATLLCLGLLLAVMLVKPLNAWMLGTLYARNLGISVSRTRCLILLCTGILSAITTAYCGPISFIGLSIPHLARLFFRTDDHGILLPASALLGSLCSLLCLLLSALPSDGTLLPLNALTPIIGVPVILYILLRKPQH